MDLADAQKSLTTLPRSRAPQFSALKLDSHRWLFPLLPAAILFATCWLRSAKTPIWFDEVISWTLSNDPSTSHMLRALSRGADGMPPAYYLVARLWRQVFGGSILSLRLLSPFGMSLGILGAWAALRKAFSFWGSALAVCAVFCTSSLLLTHNSTLRPYGLFVGLCGIALWLYVLTAERLRVSPGLAAGTAACHGALVLCHPFGIVYSGIFLAALIISDWQVGRLRPRSYMAIPLGWLAFLPWVVPLASFSSALTRSWVEVPGWRTLLLSFGFGLPLLPLIVACLVLPNLFRRGRTAAVNGRTRVFHFSLILLAVGAMLEFASTRIACFGPVLVLCSIFLLGFRPSPRRSIAVPWLLNLSIGLLLVPALAFAVSHISISIFVARYWLPSSFALAILLAAVFDNVRARPVTGRGKRWQQWGWASLLAIMLVLPLANALHMKPTDIPLAGVSRTGLEALAPAGKPIVIEDPLSFLPLVANAHPAHPYYYLLDRQSALESESSHALVTFNMMRVWFDNGYLPGKILPAQTFLATHSDFLVLHSPEFAWFNSCLAHNPSYLVRTIGKVSSFDFHRFAQLSSSPLIEVTRRNRGIEPAGRCR